MNGTERLLHYLIGGAIGATLALTIALVSGIVVMSNSVDKTVREARIEAFAAVCAARSIAEWEKEGHEMRDLGGLNNPDRVALVERFVPTAETADGLESAIATVCGNMLRVQA